MRGVRFFAALRVVLVCDSCPKIGRWIYFIVCLLLVLHTNGDSRCSDGADQLLQSFRRHGLGSFDLLSRTDNFRVSGKSEQKWAQKRTHRQTESPIPDQRRTDTQCSRDAEQDGVVVHLLQSVVLFGGGNV